MKTISAGGAGALQEFFTHSPAPLKPNRHGGCGPVFSMTAGAAGAAGEFVHLYQIKRKRKRGSKKREFRKCSFKTPAVHPKNARKFLIYIVFLGAGELV